MYRRQENTEEPRRECKRKRADRCCPGDAYEQGEGASNESNCYAGKEPGEKRKKNKYRKERDPPVDNKCAQVLYCA